MKITAPVLASLLLLATASSIASPARGTPDYPVAPRDRIDDFAWAAKYLIARGYTSRARIGIQGYSNGGLLTSASITQNPELFGAAYIGHGVLDMLLYQDFSGGALWAPKYGASSDPQAFKWLYAYSPLNNIHPGTCYPPKLITTSWDDDRVVPMHEFKFTAAIQRAQACANPILLRTTGATSLPTCRPTRRCRRRMFGLSRPTIWGSGGRRGDLTAVDCDSFARKKEQICDERIDPHRPPARRTDKGARARTTQ